MTSPNLLFVVFFVVMVVVLLPAGSGEAILGLEEPVLIEEETAVVAKTAVKREVTGVKTAVKTAIKTTVAKPTAGAAETTVVKRNPTTLVKSKAVVKSEAGVNEAASAITTAPVCILC